MEENFVIKNGKIMKILSDEQNYAFSICEIGEAPKRRIIIYSNSNSIEKIDSLNTRNYYISLPNILYTIHYKEKNNIFTPLRLFLNFTDENYSKNYVPFLPNIYFNNRVCLKLNNTYTSKTQLFDDVIKQFWGSIFHHTCDGCCYDYYGNNTIVLNKVEQLTKSNIYWIPSEEDIDFKLK